MIRDTTVAMSIHQGVYVHVYRHALGAWSCLAQSSAAGACLLGAKMIGRPCAVQAAAAAATRRRSAAASHVWQRGFIE